MRLEGPRLVLTPLSFDNVHTHFRWNNDAELNRLDSEQPFRRESFGSFLRRFERYVGAPSPDIVDVEVHLRDGPLIGVAHLEAIDRCHRHARVGLTIGERSAWGQGYGREALDLLLQYAYGTLALHRVMAEAFAYNEAWKGLLGAVGFRQEGCLRDYLHRDGRFWDKVQFALLADEYYGRHVRAA